MSDHLGPLESAEAAACESERRGNVKWNERRAGGRRGASLYCTVHSDPELRRSHVYRAIISIEVTNAAVEAAWSVYLAELPYIMRVNCYCIMFCLETRRKV